MTAATAMMVNVIPTPRTAVGAAYPERPIPAIVGYRVVSKDFEMSSQVAHATTKWLADSGPNSARAALGVGLLAKDRVVQCLRATAWKRCEFPAYCVAHAVLCHRELWRIPEGAVVLSTRTLSRVFTQVWALLAIE